MTGVAHGTGRGTGTSLWSQKWCLDLGLVVATEGRGGSRQPVRVPYVARQQRPAPIALAQGKLMGKAFATPSARAHTAPTNQTAVDDCLAALQKHANGLVFGRSW